MYELEKLKEKFPIKMGRPNVFRFRPPNENIISELESGYIWFSDRNSLNDELDSNPEFVKLSKNPDEQNLLYNTIADSILDVRTKKYFDENMNPKILQEFAQTKVEPFVNSFGIACFTMYPMNEELWEIYAKNNSGICMQFDISKDFMHSWSIQTLSSFSKGSIFCCLNVFRKDISSPACSLRLRSIP